MFNVLLVDDEPGSIKSLKYLIDWEAYGFAVTGEAANGKMALDLFEAGSYSLVITDIRMPLVDGLELTARLRSFSNVPIVIMSGYEDFDYVKEALRHGVKDYLLKPVEEPDLLRVLRIVQQDNEHAAIVSRRLHHGVSAMKDQLLKKWAHGSVMAEEAAEQLRLLDIDPAAQWDRLPVADGEEFRFCCVLVEMEVMEAADSFMTDAEIRLKRFAVRNVAEHLLQGRGHLFEESDERYGVVLYCGTEPLTPQAAWETAVAIRECVAAYAKVAVTIGVGKPVKAARDVPLSFDMAARMLGRKFLLGGDTIIAPGEADEGDAAYDWRELHDIDRIVESVGALDETEARGLLERKWRQFAGNRVAEPIVKSTAIGLYAGLLRLAEERGLPAEPSFDRHGGDYERIMREKTMAGVYNAVEEKIVAIIRRLQQLNVSQPAKTVETIKGIVQEQFSQNISIKTIAEQIYMNAAYLGQLFKAHEGVSFNDYLMRMRMEKAKQLLAGTDRKVYDIALAVGYSDTDWFYKKFKQHTGMSTGEYRAAIRR